MPEAQKDIYYVTGLSRRAVEQSPHLEAFRKRGYDVLFFIDPIDEWVTKALFEYEKKSLKSVAHGDVDLGEDKSEDRKPEEDVTAAVAAVKKALGDKVKDVRVSKRLTDSASVLVAADGDPGANFERIMKMMDKEGVTAKRAADGGAADRPGAKSRLRFYVSRSGSSRGRRRGRRREGEGVPRGRRARDSRACRGDFSRRQREGRRAREGSSLRDRPCLA